MKETERKQFVRRVRNATAVMKSLVEIVYRCGVALSGVAVIVGALLLAGPVCSMVEQAIARVPEANADVRVGPALLVFGGVVFGMTVFLYGLFGKLPEWDFGEEPERASRDLSYIMSVDSESAVLKVKLNDLKATVNGLLKALLVALVLFAAGGAVVFGFDLVNWEPALLLLLLPLGFLLGALKAFGSLDDDINKARADARQPRDS